MGCKSVQPGSTPGRASTYENRVIPHGETRGAGGELVGRWLLISAVALLAACGGGDPEPEHDVSVPTPTQCEQQPRPAACL
jgi:hypothetical protein